MILLTDLTNQIWKKQTHKKQKKKTNLQKNKH